MSENPKTALAECAYQYLYQKIITCEYMPGQEIYEKQLLEETGLGRTPLRESLLMLQKEGLVEIFPRKGMRITPYTAESVNEIYQIRKLIEPTVIEKYCGMYSKVELMDFARRFEETAQADHMSRYRLDIEFHAYLVAITGNQRLISMYHGMLVETLRLAMYAIVLQTSNREENDMQHKAIINALLREAECDARDALVYHLNHSMIISLRTLRER